MEIGGYFNENDATWFVPHTVHEVEVNRDQLFHWWVRNGEKHD
jgi:hypothetical protein